MAYNTGGGWAALSGGLAGAADALSGYVKNRRLDEQEAEEKARWQQQFAEQIKENASQQALRDRQRENMLTEAEIAKAQLLESQRKNIIEESRMLGEGANVLDTPLYSRAQSAGLGYMFPKTAGRPFETQYDEGSGTITSPAESPEVAKFIGMMTPAERLSVQELATRSSLENRKIDQSDRQFGQMLPVHQLGARASMVGANAAARNAATNETEAGDRRRANAWMSLPPGADAGPGMPKEDWMKEGGAYWNKASARFDNGGSLSFDEKLALNGFNQRMKAFEATIESKYARGTPEWHAKLDEEMARLKRDFPAITDNVISTYRAVNGLPPAEPTAPATGGFVKP